MRSGLWAIALSGCAWVSAEEEAEALRAASGLRAELAKPVSTWSACGPLNLIVDVAAEDDGALVTVKPIVDAILGPAQQARLGGGALVLSVDTSSWDAGARQLSLQLQVPDGRTTLVDVGTLDDTTPIGYADSDGDGVAGTAAADCDGSLAAESADCNDGDGSISPEVEEIPADGVDGNCDGRELCYIDGDGDGHAGSNTTEIDGLSCVAAGQYGAVDDCDDGNPDVSPSATDELCDGLDTDCDGNLPNEEADLDEDGVMACIAVAASDKAGGDCNDEDDTVQPGADETPADGVDSNCDGLELCYLDSDGDDHHSPVPELSDLTCPIPTVGYDDDCDDTDDTVFPGADELCDGQRNDCSGTEPDVGAPAITLTLPGYSPVPYDDFVVAVDAATYRGGSVLGLCEDVVLPPNAAMPLDDIIVEGHDEPRIEGSLILSGEVTLAGVVLTGGAGTSAGAGAVGGAVHVAEGNVLLRNVSVECAASAVMVERGGGIHVASDATLTAEGLAVKGCTAETGGGIAVEGTLQATALVLEDNGAIGDGGGLWASSESSGSVEGFVGYNEAGGHGGGLATQGDWTLELLTVEGNTSALDGGGLSHTGSVPITIRTTDFLANTGRQGGGATIRDAAPTLADVDFEDNQATTEVGGLWLAQGSGTASLERVTFVGQDVQEGNDHAHLVSTGTPIVLTDVVFGTIATSVVTPRSIRTDSQLVGTNVTFTPGSASEPAITVEGNGGSFECTTCTFTEDTLIVDEGDTTLTTVLATIPPATTTVPCVGGGC